MDIEDRICAKHELTIIATKGVPLDINFKNLSVKVQPMHLTIDDNDNDDVNIFTKIQNVCKL